MITKDITIALTSCGRYTLLKKTIESLWDNIDLSQYKKIMTEDSNNKSYLKKIAVANNKWFLKWWKIIYTWGSGHKETFKSHLSALSILYNNIHTEYTFHLEDDWYFKKVNFNILDLSKELLIKYPKIWIVLLRDYKEDWWLSNPNQSEEERFNELFDSKILEFKWKRFRYMNIFDVTHGFTLNPWLRRTKQIKDIMFRKNQIRIDEDNIWKKYSELWFRSVNLEPWLILHTWYWINTTWFNNLFNDGLLLWIKNIIFDVLYNSFKYRFSLIWRYIKRLFSIQKIYINFMESYFWYIFDYFLWLYRELSVKPITEKLITNIEGIKCMNIDINWFTEKKPMWISWIARLKNSDDFLEKIIESYIPYLDEIILINNLSEDNTEKICTRLLKKYPNKIKYFDYPYKVWWCSVDKKYPTNSIYSMAYYTNWSFSKWKYKYIMRLDDDNLPIWKKWNEIRNYILRKKPNKYCIYWWLNILKNKAKFFTYNKIPYSWLWWDHWIFPVSSKTYCIQKGYFEVLVSWLWYKRFGFSFFHLKFLRKWNWYLNTDSKNSLLLKPLNEISKVSNMNDINKYVPDNNYNNLITNFINETR